MQSTDEIPGYSMIIFHTKGNETNVYIACPDYKTPIRHQLAAIALISPSKTWEYVV